MSCASARIWTPASSAVLRLEQTIEDNVGLIELGEAEGDHAIVTEAEKALTKLQG